MRFLILPALGVCIFLAAAGPKPSGPVQFRTHVIEDNMPGGYTVKLTVDGHTQSQPFEILRTPDGHGTDAELQVSVRLQLKVRDDITAVALKAEGVPDAVIP